MTDEKKGDLIINVNYGDELEFSVSAEDVNFENLGVEFENLSIGIQKGLDDSLKKFDFTKETLIGDLLINVKHLDVWLIKAQKTNVKVHHLALVYERMSQDMQRALDQIKSGNKDQLASFVRPIHDKDNSLDGKWISEEKN